ncbi:MAG: hypothetical protein ACE367_06495 [Acidimicrobiales bacterium]
MTASRDASRCRPGRSARASLIRSLVVATVVATLAVGCSDDGDGAGFESEPGPIDPALVAALGDDADPQAVPAVQRDFLEMCVEGVEGSTDDLAPLERSGLLAVCGCSYEAIVEDLLDEADGETPEERERSAYSAFRSLEADLRAGNALTPEIERLVADCIRTEAGL